MSSYRSARLTSLAIVQYTVSQTVTLILDWNCIPICRWKQGKNRSYRHLQNTLYDVVTIFLDVN